MIDFEIIMDASNTYDLNDDELLSIIYGLLQDENTLIEEIKIKGKQIKNVINWKERIEG